MGSFMSILSTLLADVPQAMSMIQNFASSPIVADLEDMLEKHMHITSTPGAAAIIEPKVAPKAKVSVTTTASN